MPTYPLIVSFFTDDWEYPAYAEKLIRSCDYLNLDHRICELPSSDSWLGNCCKKPFFIRDILTEERRPVLWIDVDGSLYQRPEWFVGLDGLDFAAKRKSSKNNPRGDRPFHVSTLYFGYTPQALAFVDLWCDATGDCSDESSLNELWLAGAGKDLRWADLPNEYFEVAMGGWKLTPKTVIAHRWSQGDSKKREMADLRKRRGY